MSPGGFEGVLTRVIDGTDTEQDRLALVTTELLAVCHLEPEGDDVLVDVPVWTADDARWALAFSSEASLAALFGAEVTTWPEVARLSLLDLGLALPPEVGLAINPGSERFLPVPADRMGDLRRRCLAPISGVEAGHVG